MANALRFHAVVVGRTLRLPDLGIFEGKRVEVIVVEGEPVPDEPGPGGHRARRFGTLRGKIVVADDFDAPLPPDLLDAFEGKASE